MANRESLFTGRIIQGGIIPEGFRGLAKAFGVLPVSPKSSGHAQPFGGILPEVIRNKPPGCSVRRFDNLS
jgi:hypothetical protein